MDQHEHSGNRQVAITLRLDPAYWRDVRIESAHLGIEAEDALGELVSELRDDLRSRRRAHAIEAEYVRREYLPASDPHSPIQPSVATAQRRA